MVPVALATATATFVGQRLLENSPAFDVLALQLSVKTGAVLLPAYALLSVLTAVAAVPFIRTLYRADDRFECWFPGRPYARHVVGVLGVGILGETLRTTLGHYYVRGVGYAAIEDIFTARLGTASFFFCPSGPSFLRHA